MRHTSRDATTSRTPGTPALRPNLSRATRRDIRHAAALADELKLHSFRRHVDGTFTWTCWHGAEPAQPKPQGKGRDKPHESGGESQRKLRSRARATAHAELMQRAREFRARSIIQRWQLAAQQQPMGAAQPPEQRVSAPPPPSPPPPLPPQPQPQERMDDERPPKRQAERPSSTADTSPSRSTPNAKRTALRQGPPPGPPPPSAPPSPPSPSPGARAPPPLPGPVATTRIEERVFPRLYRPQGRIYGPRICMQCQGELSARPVHAASRICLACLEVDEEWTRSLIRSFIYE